MPYFPHPEHLPHLTSLQVVNWRHTFLQRCQPYSKEVAIHAVKFYFLMDPCKPLIRMTFIIFFRQTIMRRWSTNKPDENIVLCDDGNRMSFAC